MENLNLNAELRSKEETTKELKNNKMLAGVVYGKKVESFSIKINYSDFLRTFRKSGTSNIINLTVGNKKIEVLVQEIQKDPILGDFTHIDFFAITRGVKLTTKIPLNFIGESEAVKQGAILEENLKEIEVKCLPKDLVDVFEINLEDLKNIGDSIKVSQINLDVSVFEVLTGKDELVVMASAPKKVEETEEVEEETKEDNGEEVKEEK